MGALKMTNENISQLPIIQKDEPIVNYQPKPNETFNPTNFISLKDRAIMMSKSTIIPKQFQGSPANCFIALDLADQWNYSPLAVMRNTYVLNGNIGFSGQLVHSLLRTLLKEKLRYEIKGDILKDMSITVTNITPNKEDEESLTIYGKNITTQNSPLWKTDPAQQLSYFATRAWVRRYRPEVLLGIYTEEEIKTIEPDTEFTPITFKPKAE
jgi:hypothetical protein